MAARQRRTTIAEVAAHAGVSPATVSRVMNGRFVGEESVAERVRASAQTLDYSPSPLARGLALGTTRTVAFVVPDLANPAFQAVLSSLSKSAARSGYRVLVADSVETPSDELAIATEIRRRCDAIVLCAPRMPDAQLAEAIENLAPIVLINRPGTGHGAAMLSIDYHAGVHQLAEHLYALGHRRLVYVAGPTTSASDGYRRRGLKAFLAGHEDVTLETLPGGVSVDDGRAVAEAVRGSGATAALAFNDLVAIGLIHGLGELGVSVPGDVSVTGFDDIPYARYNSPALTTASVPHEELGVQAWDRMDTLVGGGEPGHSVLFQPRLEVRASTAPPR
ncbi:MAG: LacI family transcriptional regulator [Actinomycetales bacterium]|nr:LacI family transcriptional regulator [Actinomycetales bacterium]